ncbi:MAG: hypothetical protein JNL58_06655 [Planctomyces sp.]|nr:hypothetical protein [Planctomyces sp.]
MLFQRCCVCLTLLLIALCATSQTVEAQSTVGAHSSIPALSREQREQEDDPTTELSGSANRTVVDELHKESQKVARFRKGFFQGMQLSGSQIGGGGDDLSLTTIEANAGFAVPLGSFDNLLVVTPTFRTDFVQAPDSTDIPATLYETGVRFFHRKEISDVLSSMVIVSPLIRSDFTTSEDAFRLFGLALLSWEAVPDELTLSAGAVFLGREDLPVLPAVGLRWTPDPCWRLDLQFPQPRLSRLISKDGANSESWAYLGGGLGGSTWAVTRTNGLEDELTLRDFRFVAGYEKLISGNKGGFAEAGWVFGRSMEYVRSEFERDFDDTFVVRAGISF